MLWIILVLFYGAAKGARELLKKRALFDFTSVEVLFAYSFISFLLVLPNIPSAHIPDIENCILIVLKSLCVFGAFALSFHALKHLPVSLYGVVDLSRVLFSTLLGVFILNETLSLFGVIGLILVCTGLLMLKLPRKKTEGEDNARRRNISIAIMLLSCIMNSTSGTLDKIIMAQLNSKQLQFWFMLLLLLFTSLYVLITHHKIRFFSLIKDVRIWLMSILLIAADRALFEACAQSSSMVTVMALLKQSSAVVVIAGGRIFFKEKNTAYRLLCAGVIICGIAIALL